LALLRQAELRAHEENISKAIAKEDERIAIAEQDLAAEKAEVR